MPHVGTWIEMGSRGPSGRTSSVVPHVGTWIEIGVGRRCPDIGHVVPHVGTWIEIFAAELVRSVERRASRRHVD